MKIEDYNEYYIQNSNHYLIPKDVFMELFNEMINWKEENKILRENAENNDKVVDKVNWENQKLKEHIEKYEHYCKTTGIEELMKENQKYKEVIDKVIKLIEKTKESRYLLLLEMEVLDTLKEVE